MGSGGSKNKPKVENKTNNSGPNNGGSSESSYPQPTVSPTAVQRQVPPQDEKLPSISTKPSDTGRMNIVVLFMSVFGDLFSIQK